MYANKNKLMRLLMSLYLKSLTSFDVASQMIISKLNLTHLQPSIRFKNTENFQTRLNKNET